MRWAGVILLFIFAVACKRNEYLAPEVQSTFQLDIPVGFPPPVVPQENQLTASRVTLGKRLFFDPLLSVDNTISCGSCHKPELAFAEANSISIGVNQSVGLRNAPSLANVAYQQGLFAEGGVTSLELAALAPITEEHEMNFNLQEIVLRLGANEHYVEQFRRAYNTPPTELSLLKALAAFQRTLISGNSRFDEYYFQGKENTLTEAEKRGKELFFGSQTNCSSCHSGFLFTNEAFANIGLYEVYDDPGRGRLTANPGDFGKFKVPSLRNIAVTAPYMHNGSMATLKEVIEHFNSGGVGHANQDELIKPLNLTEQEKADLISFLHSLTDETFLNNPDHRP